MDWSIQEIAKLAGTTSRTLRHYGDVGLLQPSRVGTNGYRYYDQTALTKLQRILLLRDLGLGIPAIKEVMAGQTDDRAALHTHLDWLTGEKERLDRQIASVQRTITSLEGGEELMATEMFDGFDHTQYKEEVEQRWGKQAYADGDRWWRGLTSAQKQEFRETEQDVADGYARARAAGAPVDSEQVQAIAANHFAWIAVGWGGKEPTAEAFVGLGEMYVADERFAANYGGPEGAAYVRDAMKVYAERNL